MTPSSSMPGSSAQPDFARLIRALAKKAARDYMQENPSRDGKLREHRAEHAACVEPLQVRSVRAGDG
jgi:hypothetical protein